MKIKYKCIAKDINKVSSISAAFYFDGSDFARFMGRVSIKSDVVRLISQAKIIPEMGPDFNC
jgi:hypothetical protein